MHFDSDGKKQPYSPPSMTKLTLKQTHELVADHADSGDQEVADLLELLRRGEQQNEESGRRRRP